MRGLNDLVTDASMAIDAADETEITGPVIDVAGFETTTPVAARPCSVRAMWFADGYRLNWRFVLNAQTGNRQKKRAALHVIRTTKEMIESAMLNDLRRKHIRAPGFQKPFRTFARNRAKAKSQIPTCIEDRFGCPISGHVIFQP
jgi:hypothetical protein